ncbi:Uncharacterised protein [Collinsella intestinalis]|nr:Uncharacterised protein [Collinsella intestinalis]
MKRAVSSTPSPDLMNMLPGKSVECVIHLASFAGTSLPGAAILPSLLMSRTVFHSASGASALSATSITALRM